ncbi:alpha/beta hydrolase [Allopontixanthobacter sp.]|uniref:alpha/beta hydrolase n=1 Tax=Allopontixanthobacter sp. TaxID=2906452 RepID=UPI002ABBBF6E|nr:alpha/beta hydrolase [Allopontixanthobacter sp.]MDZ4307583.1 alpha/beta hydrolase [Allopontixanthobacter sp.]
MRIDRRVIPPSASESTWSAPDGHRIRRIDWPSGAVADVGTPRGSILFLPGRGDAYEKYLETLEQWHRAGWRVTAADWRGQAGSGRLGNDPVTGHVGDFSAWIDDIAAFWTEWKASTPGPHVIAGHSMGGHLVLRAVAERRLDPDAVVLSAPMLGFVGTVLPLPVMHGAAKLMARMGDRTRPAWKWSEKPGEVPAGRIDLLTHDRDRYDDELWWRQQRPELVMGPGSWGWVERSYASIRGLDRPGVLEAVDTPVLLIGAANDRLVDISSIERAAKRLPKAELLKLGSEARHEVLREVDPVRDRVMAAIADFLDRKAPPEVDGPAERS